MVVNTIPLSKIEFKRIEAEFYQPKFIQAKKIIGEKPLTLFGVKVIHPAEVKRTYTEKGSLKIVLAQNIRDNVMDWSTEKYMDDSVLEYISRNELLSGDVVVTRSGANYGQTSVITNEVESENLYASADVLMLKPGVIGGPLLSTFLNTRIGKLLMIRGVYGAAQPHIAPNYVSHIPFPEFLLEIRDEIADLIHSSRKLLSDSQQLYTQATELLEQELGLDKFNLDESINYKSTFFDIINSHRIDAQHYKPKFAQLINHLKDHFECVRIGTIAFYNQRGVQPVYVEDGEIDVITSQHITSTHLKYDELEKTTKAEFNNHPEAHVSFSDILIYTTGAYIGMTNPYLSNEKALASNHPESVA